MSKQLCNPAIAHWFDIDADAEHRAMAKTLCSRCPVATECLAMGRRIKGNGTYGGKLLGAPRNGLTKTWRLDDGVLVEIGRAS